MQNAFRRQRWTFFAALGDHLDRALGRQVDEHVGERVALLARSQVAVSVEDRPLVRPVGQVGEEVLRPAESLVMMDPADLPPTFFLPVVVTDGLLERSYNRLGNRHLA